MIRWEYIGNQWSDTVLDKEPSVVTNMWSIASVDFDGDGYLDLLRSQPDGIRVVNVQSGSTMASLGAAQLKQTVPVYVGAGTGLGLITVDAEGMNLHRPGAGRHSFLDIFVSGRTSADQMRSNASGIGSRIKVRSQGRWAIRDTFDSDSTPGQSLIP